MPARILPGFLPDRCVVPAQLLLAYVKASLCRSFDANNLYLILVCYTVNLFYNSAKYYKNLSNCY